MLFPARRLRIALAIIIFMIIINFLNLSGQYLYYYQEVYLPWMNSGQEIPISTSLLPSNNTAKKIYSYTDDRKSTELKKWIKTDYYSVILVHVKFGNSSNQNKNKNTLSPQKNKK